MICVDGAREDLLAFAPSEWPREMPFFIAHENKERHMKMLERLRNNQVRVAHIPSCP